MPDTAFRSTAMLTFITDLLKKSAVVLGAAFASFRRNNGLALASSLAFSAMLAIIPALFLLTALLGMIVGSSQEAFEKVHGLVTQALPAYSNDIMREVRTIAEHKRAFGVLNFAVFLLVVTPLVADLRAVLRTIFRSEPDRPFLLEKLFDIAITVVFLIGVTAVAAMGIALSIAQQWFPVLSIPAYLGDLMQYLVTSLGVFLLYYVFSGEHRVLHLAAGALASAGLWFIMRPLFHQFLVYNPGYGFAFGSFKSLFVVIIWIYYSLVVFLAGAELAASLERRELNYFRQMVKGKRDLPSDVAKLILARYERGSTIFGEGDPGDRMFAVLAGSVVLRKDDRELGRIPAGQYFGVVSFLLGTPRLAAAVAAEDVELTVVTRQNFRELVMESPELVFEMLKDSAMHLRQADKLFE